MNIFLIFIAAIVSSRLTTENYPLATTLYLEAVTSKSVLMTYPRRFKNRYYSNQLKFPILFGMGRFSKRNAGVSSHPLALVLDLSRRLSKLALTLRSFISKETFDVEGFQNSSATFRNVLTELSDSVEFQQKRSIGRFTGFHEAATLNALMRQKDFTNRLFGAMVFSMLASQNAKLTNRPESKLVQTVTELNVRAYMWFNIYGSPSPSRPVNGTSLEVHVWDMVQSLQASKVSFGKLQVLAGTSQIFQLACRRAEKLIKELVRLLMSKKIELLEQATR